MKLIDKSALVAEIKRRKELVSDPILLGNDLMIGERNAYFNLLSFIDTLEVKDGDLEHEVESYWKQCDMTWCRDAYSMTHIRSMLSDIAKHFFELGLRSTITEEDCKLIWNIGDEIPNMPEEEFFKELLKRYKAKKGE